MSGADYEYDYDYGNIDLTKRYKHILLIKSILMLNTFISDNTFFWNSTSRAIKNSYDVLETVSKLLHTAREMFEEN